jgi:hypothetical protein
VAEEHPFRFSLHFKSTHPFFLHAVLCTYSVHGTDSPLAPFLPAYSLTRNEPRNTQPFWHSSKPRSLQLLPNFPYPGQPQGLATVRLNVTVLDDTTSNTLCITPRRTPTRFFSLSAFLAFACSPSLSTLFTRLVLSCRRASQPSTYLTDCIKARCLRSFFFVPSPSPRTRLSSRNGTVVVK